jgi:hypothetical protein
VQPCVTGADAATGSRVPSGVSDLPHQADPTDRSEQTSITLRRSSSSASDRCTARTAPQRKRPLPLDLLVWPSLARQTSVKASHTHHSR